MLINALFSLISIGVLLVQHVAAAGVLSSILYYTFMNCFILISFQFECDSLTRSAIEQLTMITKET